MLRLWGVQRGIHKYAPGSIITVRIMRLWVSSVHYTSRVYGTGLRSGHRRAQLPMCQESLGHALCVLQLKAGMSYMLV